MSKIVKKILKPITTLFAGKTPEMPATKTSDAPVSDSLAAKTAAEKKRASRSRGGRASTVLRRDEDKLG